MNVCDTMHLTSMLPAFANKFPITGLWRAIAQQSDKGSGDNWTSGKKMADWTGTIDLKQAGYFS